VINELVTPCISQYLLMNCVMLMTYIVRVKEFLLGRSQGVRLNGQLYEEVRVTSGVPQGSVLGLLMFLACVNNIWRNTKSNIWSFAEYFIIYRKIMDNSDIAKLQTDLNRLRKWAVEN
jgi:hypothetical protein